MNRGEAIAIVKIGIIAKKEYNRFAKLCIQGINRHKDCKVIKQNFNKYPIHITISMETTNQESTRIENLGIEFSGAYDSPFCFDLWGVQVHNSKSSKHKLRKIIDKVIEKMKSTY